MHVTPARMPRRPLHPAPIVAFAGLLLLAGRAPARGEGAPPAARVAVNRTVPRVAPPPLAPRFSAAPTADEIRAARVFSEPVVAIGGAPTAEQSKALAAAMTAFLGRGQGGDAGAVEEILGDGPE